MDGLATGGMDEGSLLCAGAPAAPLGAQAPGPAVGLPGAEGRGPSEQQGGLTGDKS